MKAAMTRLLRNQRGFSLIEMMVAVSLMLVIVIGLFAMFSQAQRALKMATTQVDVMEPGRATMLAEFWDHHITSQKGLMAGEQVPADHLA